MRVREQRVLRDLPASPARAARAAATWPLGAARAGSGDEGRDPGLAASDVGHTPALRRAAGHRVEGVLLHLQHAADDDLGNWGRKAAEE